MTGKLILAAALALLAGAASAQSARTSEFVLTPYLWNAGFEGTMGASDGGGRVDAEFSGLLDNLEVSGMMLNADWRRDRFTVFGDWTYVKVTSDAPSPRGLLYSGANGEIKGNILQTAAGYRVLGDGASGLDLFGGLRYFDIDARLDLLPGALAARSLSGSENWVDAIVGARWRGTLTGRWLASLYGDVGTGGSNRTWQGLATLGYRFQWGAIVGGWRHLYVDYDKDGLRIDAALSGPFLGASFRF